MSRSVDARRLTVGVLLWAAASAALAQATGAFPGIGRKATPKEVTAWDIDVRPDFKGLPAGSGTVEQGMAVWEGKCASCHGVFGESNQTFSPLVGGTTAEDVKQGRVARLTDAAFPSRTTLMKVSSLSTLWDYIHRAMPWTQPKSLSPNEVYAVTAYMLNLGGIVPDNFTLSDRNMAEAQQLLPNRNGLTTDHGMWPGKGLGNGGKPDVLAKACMKDCAAEPKVLSALPDHARNAHGNLAEQNRAVGAQRGIDTTRPPAAAGTAAVAAAPSTASPAAAATTPTSAAGAASFARVNPLTQKYACVACHGLDNRVVGPGFREIAKKYGTRPDAEDYLAGKIRAGSTGTWGAIPMPPQTLSEAEAKTIASWLAAGAPR